MKGNKTRAANVTHAEYEIFKCITETVDLRALRDKMGDDPIANERFRKGAESVLQLINNMMERRRHKLPLNHVDYKEKSK